VDFPFREWERISTVIHIDQPVRKYFFAITLFVPNIDELSNTYPFSRFQKHAKIIKIRARSKTCQPLSTRNSP